ncbi:MAG: S9 family peptidase, partial [Gemmatimonadetes bacterium]|nr:S9 family peptidase [Gemmatimonadota bacterium]
MRLVPLLVLTLASCAAPAGPADGSSALIDLLAQTNAKVEQFQYSPDGSQIAYVSAKNGSSDIWVMNSDGTNARAITASYPEAEADPRWSPDGQTIAYQSRGELFLVRPDDPEHPINLTYGLNASFVQWTADSKSLIVTSANVIGLLPAAVPTSRIEVTPIATPGYSFADPQLSPDGRWLAFTADRSGKNGRWRMDIWLAPVRGGDPILLTPGTPESFEGSPRWSPDGTKLAFVSTASGWRNIGVIDVATRQVKMLTTSPWDETNPQWSPDGQWIGYVANKQWNFHVLKVAAVGGEPQQLTQRDGVNGGSEGGQVRGTFRWSPDGRTIAYTYMGPATSNDIWTMPADGGEPTRRTNHMPAGLSEEQFVAPELIHYASKDGVEVPAFLYTPRGVSADADPKPPLLVYSRANTHGMHVNGFYPFIQYFVSRGYVVLAPEIRGSGGNGAEYERLNYGDWGGGDVDDIAAGVEHLASQGLIDPNRVVMQGGSTGGYHTMQTIVKYPDLLKAAVNFYGPTNMVHMFNFFNRSTMMDILGGDHGDPTQAPDHWRERSAYYNFDRIKTPLL